MGPTQLRLIVSRRLWGLFVAQFCGALNDNLLKNALVIKVAYSGGASSAELEIIVTIATALFILPYFLFSATAGQLADKFEKAHLIRALKLWEIGVMALAGLAFAADSINVGLVILFLLGAQAAFFGPVKYGILPELLAPQDLLAGNAVIEAGTFLAILIGTIAGGLLILAPGGAAIVAGAVLTVSLLGWTASLFIPLVGRAEPRLRINPNIAAETWRVLRYARDNPVVRWSILGNSWFWFVAVAMVSQFPNYAKDILGADNQVVTFFLTANSIGIGAGSLIAGRVLNGRLTARLVPFAALAMAVFALDLWLVDGARAGTGLIGLAAFLGRPVYWRISFDLVAISLAAGLFVVPLYAIMQARCEPSHRSRVIAANNVWNALFMVGAGLGSAVMLKLGAGVTDIFFAVALGNAAVAAGTWRLRRQRET
jgi:acyl-[acyl-carrier-protein]-phospholipid O-acyltransferase / long-chain-fatty-acid--[acyl-carrier-protein] ligase